MKCRLPGLQARLVSSSYTPAAGQAGHAEMLDALALIFAQHQVDGQVHLDYDTTVFYGQPRTAAHPVICPP